MLATPLATGINLVLLALLARETAPEPAGFPEPVVVTFEMEPRAPRPRSRARPLPPAALAPAPAPPPPQAAQPSAAAPAAPAVPPEWQVDGGVWIDPARRGNAAKLHALTESLRFARACSGASSEHMTADEKARCFDRWGAAARQAAAPPLNLDPRGAYVRETQPYLQRQPKNGCKLRAGGTWVPPYGQQGVASGVACAFSF